MKKTEEEQDLLLKLKEICNSIEDVSHNEIEFVSEYCSCCGERWCSYIVDEDLKSNPTIYGEPVKEYKNDYMKEFFIFIHYIDGSIEKIKK